MTPEEGQYNADPFYTRTAEMDKLTSELNQFISEILKTLKSIDQTQNENQMLEIWNTLVKAYNLLVHHYRLPAKGQNFVGKGLVAPGAAESVDGGASYSPQMELSNEMVLRKAIDQKLRYFGKEAGGLEKFVLFQGAEVYTFTHTWPPNKKQIVTIEISKNPLLAAGQPTETIQGTPPQGPEDSTGTPSSKA